jgi:hypothetical protein
MVYRILRVYKPELTENIAGKHELERIIANQQSFSDHFYSAL